MDLTSFQNKSKQDAAKNKAFLQSLKKKDRRLVDEQFHSHHAEVFSKTDCLQCANCCKTTSPIFYQHDIERAAKALGMKPGPFIQKYLYMDEDGDFVLNEAPCAFLGADNYCSIYDSRPTACREYPHTDRKKMYQLLDLTYQNTLVCPAVLEIVERMKEGMG
jgi:hypothetical protein